MKTYDVAVIGSGIVGMSTAYELARRGLSVALVDTGLSAGASTANSSTLLMVGDKNDMLFDLRRKGLAKYQTMADELGRDVGFSELGMIGLMLEEDEKAVARKEQAFYTSFGYDYRILDRETLREMVPGLNMEGIIGANYYGQWKIDPMQTIYALYLKAREYGAVLYAGSGVTSFQVERGHITGAVTDAGVIRAGKYVVAAGAWSRSILAMLGLDLPVYYLHGSAMIAERGKLDLRYGVSLFTSERAALEDTGRELAEKYGWENIPRREATEFGILPDANGNLLIAQKSHAEGRIDKRMPTEYAHVMAELMQRFFPNLCRSRIIRSWLCPTPFPADGEPYFGYAAPYGEELFVAAGICSALLPGPAVGELAANILTGGDCPYDLTPYDPMRGMRR